MKLTPPKVTTFVVAVVIALLAILSRSQDIPFVSANYFWVMVIAFVVLALGTLFKGL
jgi:TctA family transporter